MNSLQLPGAGSGERDASAGDLDALLHTYFRAQVPEPWPAPPSPATQSLPMEGVLARRSVLVRSRFTLAASFLILLLGQLFLAGKFSGSVDNRAEGNRGRLEATHRIDAALPRESRPASTPKKTDTLRNTPKP